MSEKRDRPILGWLFWTGLVFAGGYFVGNTTPPARELLRRLPTLAQERAPAAPRAEPNDVRALIARVGEFVSRLNTREAELEASLKENRTARAILVDRGEAPESETLRRLDEEAVQLTASLEDTRAARDEALARERDLDRIARAEAAADLGRLDDGGLMLDTEALLARMEMLGLR